MLGKCGFGREYDYTDEEKHKARLEIINLYRFITGSHSLPEGRYFFSLCNKQKREPGYEIMQLTESGLITFEQYVGIDNGRDKQTGIPFVHTNREVFPESYWYFGDWANGYKEVRDLGYEPGIIYFDSLYTVQTANLADDIATTLNYCPSHTLISVNASIANKWARKYGLNPSAFVSNLSTRVHTDKRRRCQDIFVDYAYRSRNTPMYTYFFWYK